jgi:hypothetical protein
MTIRKKIRGLIDLRRTAKYASKERRAVTDDWWHIARKILPPTVREEYDHLTLTDGMYAKCIIVGVPNFDTPGYSRGIDPGIIGSLLNTAQENCFISYSFALTPFSPADSNQALEDAEFRNVQDQMSDAELNTIGHIRNKTKFIADDISKDQLEIHNQVKKQFYTSNIITVKASSLHELDIAYGYVTTILGNNLIGYVPAEGKMLEMYKSAQPWGSMAYPSVVDCLSSQVAALLPVKRLSSRTAATGIWVGNTKMANPEDVGSPIMLDLNALSAKHWLLFGPTGAGKTVAMITLGMRFHDQTLDDPTKGGGRVIYLTVKADSSTQFRNIPRFYEELGGVIDFGVGADKSAINPLQIVYDRSAIDGSPADYLRIYHKHKSIVYAFFDAFLKVGLTDNQSFYLDKTLNEIYAKHGLITLTNSTIMCHPEKWADGANFPTIHELRELWAAEMKSGGLKRLYESAESLYNRTGNLSEIGAYSYINARTTVDLSKDYIVIDLSGLDKAIQGAMSTLMIELIGARFNTDADRETFLLIDEGVTFAHSADRQDFVSNSYMMGRSGHVSVGLSLTHPGEIDTGFATMLKTNSMWSIILGKGMSDESVGYVSEFFSLHPEDEIELKNSAIGEGLLRIGNQTIPLDFKVTDQEMMVIKGIDEVSEKTSSDSGLMVLGVLSDLVQTHGFCLDDWIDDTDPDRMFSMGYRSHLVQRVTGKGTAKAWILQKILKDGNHIHNQTIDHYASVIQIAGHLLISGFEDVQVNHFEDVDVLARLGAKTFSFEYERPGSHTEKQLTNKMRTIENNGSRCFFVCPGENAKAVTKAVGAHNTYTRGASFEAAIDAVLTENEQHEKEDTTDE